MKDSKGLFPSCKRTTQVGSPVQRSSWRQAVPCPAEHGCAVPRPRQLFQAGNGAEHVLPLPPAPLCRRVLGQVWMSSGLCYLAASTGSNLFPHFPAVLAPSANWVMCP